MFKKVQNTRSRDNMLRNTYTLPCRAVDAMVGGGVAGTALPLLKAKHCQEPSGSASQTISGALVYFCKKDVCVQQDLHSFTRQTPLKSRLTSKGWVFPCRHSALRVLFTRPAQVFEAQKRMQRDTDASEEEEEAWDDEDQEAEMEEAMDFFIFMCAAAPVVSGTGLLSAAVPCTPSRQLRADAQSLRREAERCEAVKTEVARPWVACAV